MDKKPGQRASLCKEYASTGSCRLGDKCRFSHGNVDDIHRDRGKQLCPHFTQGRVCNYGASCRYSHDATSRQPTAITGLQLRERVKALLSSPELTTDISVLYAREVEQAAPLVALRRPDIRSLGRIDEYRVGVFLSAGLHQLATDSHTFLLDIDEKSSVWATLRELIEHTEYVCASQSGRIVVSTATSATPLSFQRCMVPLMFIVGHPALERSSLSKAVNYLLSPIANSLLPFLTTYTACVAELLDKGTLSDNLCPVVKPGQFSPVSFAQVFLPLAKCLELVFSRFVEVTRNKTVKEALAHVDTLVQRWHDKVQGNELSTVEVPYAVNIVRATLEQATRCFADSVSFEDQIRARREQLQAYERAVEAEKGAMVPLWKGDQLHPPAQIHSNDKLMYREISILPTMDEIFCTEPPTLPGNCQYESAAHWLGPGPERLLDTHFRLLRHDMVSSLKASVAAFVDTLRKSYKRSTSSTPPALEHSGRLKLQGRNTTDLMVYSGVHCTGVINTGDRGQSVAVAFQLPESSNGRSSASFWEKCLLRDGLVCLIYQHDVGDAAANTADITHGIAFAVITDRDDPQSRAQRRPADSNAPQITFWEHPGHAHKQKGAILLNFGDRTLPQELWNTRNSSQHTSRRSTRQSRVYMIEARNVLYESYRPVLEALQLKKASDIPFSNILCPEELPTAPIHVPPPLYTQAPGFSFDLTFLTPDGTSPGPDMLRLQPTDGDQVIECQEKLQQYTTLDASQSHALVQALSSTVSAIQGPPGTGKSFIGVKIVQAIHRLDTDTVYPILVVCYTNHALDQFLENLLDVGIHSIARIGSKMSDRLKEYRADRWSDRSLREKVKDLQQQLTEYSSELAALQTASKNNINDPTMRDVFKAVLPLHHEAINRRHHARFQTRGSAFDYWYQGWDLGDADKSPFSRSDKRAARKGERLEDKNKFSALAHIDGDDQTDEAIAKAAHKNVKQPRPVEELVADNNLWDMPGPERIKLGRHIIATVLTAHAPRIQALQAQIAKIHAELQDTQIVRMVEALRNKKVIGMTTTGAAKQCKALQALQPKIILCEEAGEVLEAHILALLGSYVQQLVLIGDHQQLRPKVDAYELSAAHSSHYRLDISLFERLIVPESARQCHVLPHVTLTQQRRMRPVISQFVRQSGVYKDLTDGPNTLDYPDVVGVAKNVFFLAHNEPQETKQDAFTTVQSHVNPFEVEMSAALVKYMLQQDYKPGQIVVLTPYLGQLQRIRQELLRMSLLTQIDDRDRKQLDLVYTEDEIASNEVLVKDLNLGQSVRVSTVDNYQGEEADIIIISLVRSHFADGSDRGIGFVKLDNRVTVLLSRARHGMFLLGNADLFQEKSSPLWTTVLDLMSEQGLIGPAFPAMCAKHPEHRPTIQKASDFALFMPDGGCLEACDFRLPCGHACLRKCHRDNSDHAQLRCRRPCSHGVKEQRVDLIMGETYAETDIDEHPVIVLKCGHIFTVETLDGMLGLANYYNKLGNQWVDAKLLPDESENNSLPACPDCRAPILTCNARRYGRVIKQAVLVLANKYTVSDFRTKLTALQQSIDEIPAMIEGIQTMPAQQMKTRGRPVDPRIKRSNEIQATISTLRKRLRNVRKEIIDNATRKLYDACQRALKQKQRCQALERTNIVRQYTVDEGTTQFLEGHLDAHTMTLRFSAQAQEAYRLFISALRHYDHAVDLFKRGQASTRMMQIKIAQLALYKSYLLLQWQYRDSTKFAGLSPEKQKVWLDATSALNDEAVRFTSQVDKDTIDIRARAREYGDYDCDRALQEYQAYFADSKERCDRGLAPSMSEIKAIVAVLQDIPGGATRWYTCPNGHYYAVGDCGGVVTEGRCMECGAAIGGTSYALREGNRSAHGL
ncbi:hypothetical protein RI367_007688 [Sorochytrium milnesiophthora]